MLYHPSLTRLELRVADLVFGTSSFYQKAFPKKLEITYLDNGGREVRLKVQPVAFEMLAGDAPGQLIPASFLNPPEVTLVGNSSCAVDAATGQPLYRLVTPQTARNLLTDQVEQFDPEQDWAGFLEAKPELLLLQSDFLGILSSRMEISIDDLTLEYLQQADAAPSRFTA